MSPFLSGALGAAVLLLAVGLFRRACWRRMRRGLHRAGAGPFFLRGLFRRLGTRPEQEAVVSAEADALGQELRALRQDAQALRGEVAELLAAPALDAASVSRVLEARLARLEGLKLRLGEALARTHGVLDPEQRARLAALVRSGLGHHRRAACRC
jgi:hypothetical protein